MVKHLRQIDGTRRRDIRIAIFTEVFLPKIDGITNRLKHTIQELHRRGDKVVLFCPMSAIESFPFCEIVRVPGFKFPPYPEVPVSLPDPRIILKLKRFKPDLIHAVGPVCLGTWGLQAARWLGIPAIASYHTDLPKYMPHYGFKWLVPKAWSILKSIHDLASVNLCPSQHTKQELEQHGIGDVGVWRGGVNTEIFRPSRRNHNLRRDNLERQNAKRILLYVGRLSQEKGVAKLAPIMKSRSDCLFWVVGDGPARPELERLFQGTKTTFWGFQANESLAELYASADLFVMPSETETLGFVTMEALSSGLPVIAANAGGTKDIVVHQRNGLLYEPGDSQGLANCLDRLLLQPRVYHYLASHAIASAALFSWGHETEILRSYYRAVVGQCEMASSHYQSIWSAAAIR